MFDQLIAMTGAVGNANTNVTLQQNGVLVAVEFDITPNLTLGASKEASVEVEVSLNNVLSTGNLLCPPNGVIAKGTVAASADLAGTSMTFSNPCKKIVPVPARRLQQGQVVYINSRYLYQISAGVITVYGWCILKFK